MGRRCERMRDEKLAKRADAQNVDGKVGKRDRKMRWENCVKRNLETVGGNWRITAKDTRSWRLSIENAAREK